MYVWIYVNIHTWICTCMFASIYICLFLCFLYIFYIFSFIKVYHDLCISKCVYFRTFFPLSSLLSVVSPFCAGKRKLIRGYGNRCGSFSPLFLCMSRSLHALFFNTLCLCACALAALSADIVSSQRTNERAIRVEGIRKYTLWCVWQLREIQKYGKSMDVPSDLSTATWKGIRQKKQSLPPNLSVHYTPRTFSPFFPLMKFHGWYLVLITGRCKLARIVSVSRK